MLELWPEFPEQLVDRDVQGRDEQDSWEQFECQMWTSDMSGLEKFQIINLDYFQSFIIIYLDI